MSVLIKGMDMPHSCSVCIMKKWNWCGVTKGNVEYEVIGQKRRKDCPLIEVPTPHGRLKDADKMDLRYCGYWANKAIQEAPTVIEAED